MVFLTMRPEKFLNWPDSIGFDFPHPKRGGYETSTTVFRSSGKTLVSGLTPLISGSRAVPVFVMVMLAFACVLPVIIRHDPWKADEGYTFGDNYDLLQTGDWMVP